MFDLDQWYSNLDDEKFDKYQEIKTTIRGLLVGTGETKDTTMGKLIGLHDEMFGTSIKTVSQIF